MFKLLTSVGIVVTLLVGTVLGIQFMLAGAEGKAKVQESLIPFAVGCIVIFGAFTIWSIVVNIGQNVAPIPSGTGQSGTSSTEEIDKCPSCKNPIDENEKNAKKCTQCGSGIDL